MAVIEPAPNRTKRTLTQGQLDHEWECWQARECPGCRTPVARILEWEPWRGPQTTGSMTHYPPRVVVEPSPRSPISARYGLVTYVTIGGEPVSDTGSERACPYTTDYLMAWQHRMLNPVKVEELLGLSHPGRPD